MRFLIIAGLALGLGVAAPAFAAVGDPAPLKSWNGRSTASPGRTTRADLQHGFQVYKEVCSACHSLNRVAFHTLSEPGGPGFTDAQMKADRGGLQHPGRAPTTRARPSTTRGNPLTRPGGPADHFPPPFANEEAARAANGGACRPTCR